MDDERAQEEVQAERENLEPPGIERDGDDIERFATDIVLEVYHWKAGIESPTLNVPAQGNFRYTQEHKVQVIEFLEENGKALKKLVSETKKEHDEWNYDGDNYLNCKRQVVEEFKSKTYNEIDFVKLCAAIALIAIGEGSATFRNTRVVAANELCSFINEILAPGGTLQNSTWAEA